MDEVRFLDLGRLHRSIAAELRAAFEDVLETSAFVGGAAVAGFEQRFADAHGRQAAASCASGTDALGLALRAVGIGPGDEVVVPAMTFVATAEAVVHAGGTPVVADVDPATLLLSAASVRAVWTERTRAVVPVHLYGHMVPFDLLADWRHQGVAVVEDAAQAHLGTWEGASVGTVGRAACFSFFPGKNLGALGDGGVVLSDDGECISTVKRLRDHGRVSKYEHEEIGFCSRLDGLQAAFLDVKLTKLPEWTRSRQSLAERYRERLDDRAGQALRLVPWETGAVHHLMVVRVPAVRRDEVRAELARRGVQSGIHYPVPLSRQAATTRWAGPCPAAELASAEIISLPLDPLMAREEVDFVCDELVSVLDGDGR
ncbi:MAG: DegT/DnrJ/EryC1/StrS family aminotransferase [Actinomycetota bacterium]|nr:DegT/DnrJ/EryC1/StrS family aminotransferase [Actinomycetota bacterium]